MSVREFAGELDSAPTAREFTGQLDGEPAPLLSRVAKAVGWNEGRAFTSPASVTDATFSAGVPESPPEVLPGSIMREQSGNPANDRTAVAPLSRAGYDRIKEALPANPSLTQGDGAVARAAQLAQTDLTPTPNQTGRAVIRRHAGAQRAEQQTQARSWMQREPERAAGAIARMTGLEGADAELERQRTLRNPYSSTSPTEVFNVADQAPLGADPTLGQRAVSAVAGAGAGRVWGDWESGVIGSTGSTLAHIGRKAGVADVAALGDAMGRYSQRGTPRDNSFADKIVNGFGSMGAFLIPGLGVMRGTEALAILAPTGAKWLGAGVMGGLEAAAEADNTYKDLLRQGHTEQSAGSRAEAVFWQNMALLGVTDKMGFFNDLKGLGGKVLATKATEGGQEFAQQIIQNRATDKPLMEGAWEAGALGAIVGAGTAAAQHVGQQAVANSPYQQLADAVEGNNYAPLTGPASTPAADAARTSAMSAWQTRGLAPSTQTTAAATPSVTTGSLRADLDAVMADDRPMADIHAERQTQRATAAGLPPLQAPAVATLPDGTMLHGSLTGLADDGTAEFESDDGATYYLAPGEVQITEQPEVAPGQSAQQQNQGAENAQAEVLNPGPVGAALDAAPLTDFTHLDALELGLSNERSRLNAARTEAERTQRSVLVKQMEKEIAGEREFLGLPPAEQALEDDALLAALEVPAPQAPTPAPRTPPKSSPIMRRQDLVGAIMRATGGRGIAANQALTLVGDTANRASKVRGLFTNDGWQDLDAIAELLRVEEGYDVADGNALAELVRRQAGGERVISMERQEQEAAAGAEKQHREAVRTQARKLGVKTVGVPYADVEATVLRMLEERHTLAVAKLSDRDRKRFEAAVTELEGLITEAEMDGILTDAVRATEGMGPRAFWQRTTTQLRAYLDALALQRSIDHEESARSAAATGGAFEELGDGRTTAASLETPPDFALEPAPQADRPAETEGLNKAQIDREAAHFGLEQQSQPKPQGVQAGLFTADGRVSVDAATAEGTNAPSRLPTKGYGPRNKVESASPKPAAEIVPSQEVPRTPGQREEAAGANTQPQAPAVSQETLESMDLLREFGGRWQYRVSPANRWFTANTQEGAVEQARKAYASLTPEERLTKAQRTAAADAEYDAQNEQRYGKKTDAELQAELGHLEGEIASLQRAGRNEFDGNGGRRSRAATSNEGARQAGEEKMRLQSYLRQRQRQADPKTAAQADLDAALGDLGDLIGKPFRASLTPEQEQKLLPIMTRVFDAAFRMGYYKFKEAARFVLDTIRTKLGGDVADQLTIDHLQGGYIAVSGRYRDQGADSAKEVVQTDSLEALNAQRPREPAEPDPGEAPGDAAPVQDDTAGTDRGTGSAVPGAAEGGRAGQGSSRVSKLRSADAGKRGDQSVHRPDGEFRSEDAVTRGDQPQRGLDLGDEGLELNPGADEAIEAAAQSSHVEKLAAQRAAESVAVKVADRANIDATLPFLNEGQREDVAFAETRWQKPDGYGVLFTNGTGTGKTYLGLGLLKRLVKQGKTNGLIVAPNEAVIRAWVESAPSLGLAITPLADTQDAGRGVAITTYANFGANQRLADREYDFVAIDEAHLLMMSKGADTTDALAALRAISLHPDGAYRRYEMRNSADIERFAELSEKIKETGEYVRRLDTSESLRLKALEKNKERAKEAEALRNKLKAALEAVKADVEARQGAARTRTLFLSATPFAYETNVQWGAGYLFDYPETKRTGYNQPNPYQAFMIQHFGYRMRTNKLNEPDAKVDRDLMQRQFNTWMRKQGALSARMLDVDQDYERKFILIEGGVGQKIDEGLNWLRTAEHGRYHTLYDAINDRFDYLTRARLLEAIKAQAAVPYIQKHHALGRKVVVFYDFNTGGGINVFNVAGQLAAEQPERGTVEVAKLGQPKGTSWTALEKEKVPLRQLLREFVNAHPDLQKIDFTGYTSPLDTLLKAFPWAGVYNGLSQYKKTRLQSIRDFNDDTKPGANLLLVQKAANAGWSGHDTSGKHARVLLNLGQPTAPTEAIQQEGRIYRVGQASDANFQYFNTGTNWERFAFGSKISRRAGTAENLAMGEQARGLREAFIQAFEASDGAYEPSDADGKGGKAGDRALVTATTDWERAKALYYGQQKKTSRTKAQEGTDYFATPEPLGLKMVEWADGRFGDKWLEPSAGHGAIARWFPEKAERTVVEPSLELASRLTLATDAKLVQDRFENFNTINKADAIVMNPPFGTGGKTAIEHLSKAFSHLNPGGRIVALIPEGPAADKRFEAWLYGTTEKPVKPLYEHPKFGPIYEGDTLTMSHFGSDLLLTVGHIDGSGEGARFARPKGERKETAVNLVALKGVEPTGPRKAEAPNVTGASLVGSIGLPTATFERAGTSVKARVVIIDKSAQADSIGRIDLNADSVADLFDRLENLQVPPRRAAEGVPAPVVNGKTATDRADIAAKEREVQAEAAGAIAAEGEEAVFELKDKKLLTNAPTVKVTTKAGKELTGVKVPDEKTAKAVDEFTYQPWGRGNGWLVRLRHVERPAVLESIEAPRQAGHDVDRAWRDLISKNKFSDFDEPAEFEATRNDSAGPLSKPREFTLSKREGKQWVALAVKETEGPDGDKVFSSSLEVGGDGFPKGTGIATRMYLSALNVAQRSKVGWMSEGVRSDESQAIYRRLKNAGVPFEGVGRTSYLDAETLVGVDLQSVADRFAYPSILESLEDDQARAVTQAIDRAIAAEQGLDVPPLKRESARKRLEVLRRDLEAGKLTTEQVVAEVEALHARLELVSQNRKFAPPTERQRGADYIRQRLLEAKRRGDLSAEAVDLAEWFILKNPALVEDLGVSVRQQPAEGKSAGNYTPFTRIVTLFKGVASDTTAVHEVLHHLERLMPAEMQTAIQHEWLRAVTAEAKKATGARALYLDRILLAHATGFGPFREEAGRLITSGKVPYADYQYLNASEYWAVRMASAVEARHGSVWQRAARWLREALEHIKGALRLRSDAPLLKALNQLLRESDGSQQSAQMLSKAGEYNEPAERLLRAARKPSMAEDSSIFDHILGGKFLFTTTGADRLIAGTTGRALDWAGSKVPEIVKAGLVSDYGLTGAYLDRKEDMKAAEAAQARRSFGMIETLAGLTRAESRVAYEWMQEKPDTAREAALLAELPEASRKTLADLKQMVTDLGAEAVQLGQLPAESYERNKNAYLHITYAKHVLANEGFIAQRLRARTARLRGEQYKGRGIFENVEMRRIQNAAPEWWGRKLKEGKADTALKGQKFIRFEQRDVSGTVTAPLPGMTAKAPGRLKAVTYWPADEPVPGRLQGWVQAGEWEVRGTKGAQAILWRDLTKEERVRLGELDEVRYAVAQTLQLMIHDVEVGRFFAWVGKEYGKPNADGLEVKPAKERLDVAYAPSVWVEVPGVKLAGTQTRKYGALAGLYVPGPVWNDLRQIATLQQGGFMKLYAPILRFWKKSKTSWSPGVHVNNVMANFVMADWHDIRAGDLVEALTVWARNGREGYRGLWERFEDSGALGGMFASNELLRDEIALRLEELKADLTMGPEAELGTMAKALHLLALVTVKPAQAYAKGMTTAYQNEDAFFRLAVWLKAVRYGHSDRDAGQLARHAFLNYDINAPWVQAARHSVLPFVSFFYRALPMLVETARTKPWKAIKLMAFWSLVSAIGAAMSGGDDDKERALLPDEKGGDTWGLVPKMIRMPWNHDGAPIYLDIRRWVPVGDVFDLQQGHGFPPWLVPGGPLVALAEVLPFVNKSIFTQKEIVKDTDSAGEASVKRLDYLFKSMAPNIPAPNPLGYLLPTELGQLQTYGWGGIEKAYQRKENTVGEVRTVPMAMLNALGVKVGSYPANNLIAAIQFDTNRQVRDVQKEIARIQRDFGRLEQPTEAQRAEVRAAIMAEADKITALKRKAAGKIQPPPKRSALTDFWVANQ